MRFRFITVQVMMILVLLLCCPAASDEPCRCRGDMNDDQQVDLEDLQVVAQILLDEGSPFIVPSDAGDCADINSDGQIDLEDLQATADILLDAGRPFIVPCSQPAIPMELVSIPGKSWEIGKYEVTNIQYCNYLNSANTAGLIKVVDSVVYASSDSSNTKPYFDTHSVSPYSQIDFGGGLFSVRSKDGYDMSNHPLVEVSWYGANAFCDYYGYRLPTEDEWEYAARGGLSGMEYPWGNTWDNSRGNCKDSGDDYEGDSRPRTTPVDYYPAQNNYGLYDMAGNMWEWTSLCYYSDCHGCPGYGGCRVLRGGAWSYDSDSCRVSSRGVGNPSFRSDSRGFRVARDLN